MLEGGEGVAQGFERIGLRGGLAGGVNGGLRVGGFGFWRRCGGFGGRDDGCGRRRLDRLGQVVAIQRGFGADIGQAKIDLPRQCGQGGVPVA